MMLIRKATRSLDDHSFKSLFALIRAGQGSVSGSGGIEEPLSEARGRVIGEADLYRPRHGSLARERINNEQVEYERRGGSCHSQQIQYGR